MTDLEKELEKALSGKSTNDEVAPLAETADSLRTAFTSEVPEARGEQLLFTKAVGLRKRSGLGFRLLVPAVAVGSFLLALIIFGRTAAPDGPLYPVRGALKAVGLAEGPVEEVEEEIDEARHDLAVGERLMRTDPEDAGDEAYDAIDAIQDARELLPDLSDEQRAIYRARLDSLELDARDLIKRATRAEDREERREDSLDDDNSGPGGGDDDNSGSGSDDSGGEDDNSGSGSDDSGGDDSSGSGSSGSGSDDDNSGSGSSSSGSGSSGSGSDDS